MIKAFVFAVLLGGIVQPDRLVEHADPRGFRFLYPEEFGAPSRGTDDGFESRVAAFRFATFSAQGIGGEAALTKDFPLIDIQAVGGLYDDITLTIFTTPLKRQVLEALPRLSAANFCSQIGREQHLDPVAAPFAAWTTQQRTALASVDRMRNVNPRVVRCVVEQSTVTFDKEVNEANGPRQHVYGAVRFLGAPYSTFQIVRAGQAPDSRVLGQMTVLVNSWRRI